MIDRDQWLVLDERDGLGGGQADNHATDQARPAGGGDPVDRIKADAGLFHGIGDDEIERFHMSACGYFRHDAAERGMLIHLRQHHIGENIAAAVLETLDDGRRSLIAGRFNAKDDHQSLICPCGLEPLWPCALEPLSP